MLIIIVLGYCSQEVANGFLWPRILEENIVKLPCNLGGSSFRAETMATRHCLIGGIWSEPDLSTCTLKKNVDLLLLVWFVLEADQLPDDNKTRLLELMVHTWSLCGCVLRVLRVSIVLFLSFMFYRLRKILHPLMYQLAMYDCIPLSSLAYLYHLK